MSVINWIQYNEFMVGQNDPTLADTLNRSLMSVISQSGLDPSASFPGFLPLSGGTVTGNLSVSGTLTFSGNYVGNVIAGQYGGTGVNNSGKTITVGGNLVTANTFTTSGNFALTLTVTASTNITLPTTGTLVNTAVTSLSSLTAVGILASTHLTSPVIDSGGLAITAGNVTLSSGYIKNSVSNLMAGVFTPGCTTSAKTIYTPTNISAGVFLLVYGDDGAGNSFLDLVAYYSNSTGAVGKTLLTVQGTPASRTYGVAVTQLQVTMGSGTYGIRVSPTELA